MREVLKGFIVGVVLGFAFMWAYAHANMIDLNHLKKVDVNNVSVNMIMDNGDMYKINK